MNRISDISTCGNWMKGLDFILESGIVKTDKEELCILLEKAGTVC